MSTKTTQVTPRASANLTISFGMVNIEVGLGNLVEPDPGIKGKTICSKHRENVKRHWWCEAGQHDCTDESESVFEVDGKLIHLDTSELESERDGIVHLNTCVTAEEIDSLYFETTYLVWPRGASAAGYDLLANALREMGKVALGTCVLRKNSRLFVLRWSEITQTLLAQTCNYDENVRWYNAKLVADAAKQRPAPDKKLAAMAVQLLSGLDDEFHPERYHDDYQARLREALEAAAKGKKPAAKPEEKVPEPQSDLMAALQASLAEAKKAKAKPKPTSNGRPRVRVKK